MRYAVITFGCRVNQADSLGFEEELLASDAVPSPPEDAELVIVNTCSVTATADQGARQTIRRIARDNPAARIVVTGCYATRRPDDVAALPNVTQVVCNDDKPTLLPLVAKATAELAERAEKALYSAVSASSAVAFDGPCGAAIEPGVAGRTAFTLRVQTGCNEPCSYCIIPATRGAPRSVPFSDVRREIDRVSAAGFKEIALTGVHLGSYGRDLEPRESLVGLLRSVAAWRHDSGSDVRFRISSLEPMDCPRELIDLVVSSDCFAPHFHLPLQHASNRILSAMRRPYTIEYYSSLVEEIRARLPHASIGADVIVGFPGESAADHDALVGYLESSPLTHLHVFPYSDRPGTPASRMANRASGGEVRERARRTRDIGAALAARFRAAQIGTVHHALTLDDGTVAVTGNYLKVAIPRGRRRNEWVTLRVTDVRGGVLMGEVVEPTISRGAESSAPAPP